MIRFLRQTIRSRIKIYNNCAYEGSFCVSYRNDKTTQKSICSWTNFIKNSRTFSKWY
jgi:hypothetical protein